MISISQIQRMVDHGNHRQLIRRVLSNGRCMSPAIREHLLGQPGGPDVPTIAAGIALQRCCELTYLPTDLATDLAGRLTATQMPDGRFGIADETALAATAIALRGLIEYRDQLDSISCVGGAPQGHGHVPGQVGTQVEHRRTLDAAIEQAMDAVSELVQSALETSDHVTGVFIALWQLGHLAWFRARVGIDSVLARLRDGHAHDLDGQLVDYVYAQAA